jgi:simple sugar transport system ATP-binding protein
MLGRNLIEQKTKPSKRGELLFELRDLHLGSQLKKINLQMYKGEILGIAGVEGNGQSELMNILISPKAFQGELNGEIFWKNSSVKNFDAKKMRDLGLRFLPEDRLGQGCLLSSSLKDNFIFGQQRSKNFQRWNFLNDPAMTLKCQSALQEFDVRPADPDLNFVDLSGGNQQKLVVARELSQDPELLIAAQPTRGVDIGAGQKIHQELLEMKNQGASVLLISSELDEVLKLSDRILVMFQGSIIGEISNWSSLPESKRNEMIPFIGKLMVGSASGKSEVPL